MAINVLSKELACERAWQVYCLMNPAAHREIKLKTRLDHFLSTLATADSRNLTVDGLKYLKRLEGRSTEKSGEHC